MPNLNAALGVAQLEILPELLAAKRTLAQRYADAFASVDGVTFQREPAGCESNYWLNLVLLPDRAARDALLEAGNDAGLQLRPFWTPLHTLPMYTDAPCAPLEATAGTPMPAVVESPQRYSPGSGVVTFGNSIPPPAASARP